MAASNPLQDALERMQGIRDAENAGPEALREFVDGLAETGALAAVAGFPGVLELSLLLQQFLADSIARQPAMDSLDLSVLAGWPEALLKHLAGPDAGEHKDQLLAILTYPAWGAALAQEDAQMLRAQLDIRDDAGARPPSAELAWDEESAPAAGTPHLETADIIAADVPAGMRDLVTIMLSELAKIRESIAALEKTSVHGGPDPGMNAAALHELARSLQFYEEAVASIEFNGLAGCIRQAAANLNCAIAAADPGTLRNLCGLLREWSDLALGYLRAPLHAGAASALVDLLADPRWPAPVSTDDAGALRALFGALPDMAAAPAPEKAVAATPEDVSITLPGDVDQDLLEALLQELPGQTESLTVALQRLASGGNTEDLLVAKRVAHTLKGAGNTVGIRGIATITHHLEDILLTLHKQNAMPTTLVTQTLMNAADCLAAMSESLLGRGDAPANALGILQEILAVAGHLQDGGGAHRAEPQAAAETAHAIAPPADTARQAEPETEAVAMLRVPADMIDQLLRMSAENQILYGQLQNFIEESFQQLKEVRAYFEELRGLGGRMEELADVKDLGNAGAAPRSDGYDALEMDHYTELHSHSRRMAEITVDAGEASRTIATGLTRLKEVIGTQSRLSHDAQSLMLKTRMLPANTHLSRWQRCVRQAARLTGKQAGLRLIGGETLVDGTILNALLDPLMHLLRNAVDHGIESPDTRVMQGKNPEGVIELEFYREGPYIQVVCRDDGRGMNLEAIRSQAIARGMLAPDQDASEEELHQFVLQPGFSTKQEVSQVSGRGIGMDAVCSSITEQSGSLSLRSEAGRGCTIQIRLPQDLLSIFGLLVRSGRRLVVLATRGITQIVHHATYELRGDGDDLRLRMHDLEVEAVPLEQLLRIAGNRRQGERRPRTAILFRTDAGQRAVLVERILASQSFAVKGLGDFIPKLPGIAGATLLGDGTVAPVLDVADLLRHPIQALPHEDARHAAADTPAPPTALVVDDSMSARRSLAQFMHDAGYQVRQARDGSEALEIIQARCPDILLTDLEMPRINGMELTGRVRADPRTAHLPIILITSRATTKHQQEALAAGVNAYLTKPFSEERLLAEIQRLRGAKAT